jgi:hypothetical protein
MLVLMRSRGGGVYIRRNVLEGRVVAWMKGFVAFQKMDMTRAFLHCYGCLGYWVSGYWV